MSFLIHEIESEVLKSVVKLCEETQRDLNKIQSLFHWCKLI